MGNHGCCVDRTMNTITLEVPENNPKSYSSKQEDKFRKIQKTWKIYKMKKREREKILAKTQLLENRVAELGRYIDKKYVTAKISKKIIEVEKNLPPFKIETNLKELHGKDKILREPFEYKLDKSIYCGLWNEDGLRHGYGYLVRDNGSKLEGYWKDGELFRGRIFDNAGNVYEGNIKNLEPVGEGTYTGVNGLKFTGNWKNGTYNDYGVLTLPDRTVYKGYFLNGLFEGKGNLTLPNGMSYDGNFKNNSITGKGRMTTRDGDFYTGDWENNIPHGNGTYEWTKHESKYVGEYKYGRKDGNGRYELAEGDYYDGMWFNDKPHGVGVYLNGKKEMNGTWRYGTLIESSDPTDTSRRSVFLNEFWKTNNNILQNIIYAKNLGNNQSYTGNFIDLIKL
jgi:hypothetical protein